MFLYISNSAINLTERWFLDPDQKPETQRDTDPGEHE